MTRIAERVLEEARDWLGTPYLHQASVKGVGSDCLGLIRGIWRALYGAEPCMVPPYSADWAEISREEGLWRAATLWLVPRPAGAAPALGDVILFRMREGGIAKHLGVQSVVGEGPRFIHAYSGHDVCESMLTGPWARRIAARFSFPTGE